MQVSYPERRAKYKWFARLLLEGQVLPRWKSPTLRKGLAVEPAALTREIPHAKALPLVRALESRRLDSAASLRDAWAADPTFLQTEVLGLIADKATRQRVRKKWAVLCAEA